MCLVFLCTGVAQAAAGPSDYEHTVCVPHLPLVTDLASTFAAYDVETLSSSLYDTLVRLDDNGFASPSLAQSWEVLEQGKLFRFRLRPGVRFHSLDGFVPTRTLDASDVVFSLNRLLSSEAYFAKVGDKTALASVFPAKLVESISGEGLTLEIRLRVADYELLEKLSAYDTNILSLEYAQYLELHKNVSAFIVVPIGTGPFQYYRHDNRRFTLRRFDQHWRGPASMASLTFVAVADDLKRLSDLRMGRCAHAVDLGPRLLDRATNFDGFVVQRTPIFSVLFLAVDTRFAPWNDPRARQALSLAINRRRIVHLLFSSGGGEPAATSIHPKLLGLPGAQSLAYDPERARKLLLKVLADRPVHLKISSFDLSRPHNPSPRRLAQLVAENLEEIGVSVDIEWVPIKDIVKTINDVDNPRYESLLMGASADAPLASAMANSLLGCVGNQPSALNYSRMCDEQVAQLIAQATSEADAHKRQKLFRAAANASLDKMQYINLLHAERVDIVRDDLQGVRRLANGGLDFRDATKSTLLAN